MKRFKSITYLTIIAASLTSCNFKNNDKPSKEEETKYFLSYYVDRNVYSKIEISNCYYYFNFL